MTGPQSDPAVVPPGPLAGLDVVAVHQRYVELASRFKSAWTFHQFLEGMQRVFVEHQIAPYVPGDFKGVYSRLKQVADSLAGASAKELTPRLDEVEALERELFTRLLEQDSKVSTSLQRLFFQRVATYDPMVVARLLRFYLHALRLGLWRGGEDFDKADLLASKLAEMTSPGEAEPDWERTRALLERVVAGGEPKEAAETALAAATAAALERLEAARDAASRVVEVEELRRLIAEHRAFKHALGERFFEPPVLVAVTRSNWSLRRAVARVVQREERSIFAESERILELEGRVPLTDELDERVTAVRREIASFEQRMQSHNVRLDEISSLRRSLDSLMPQLGEEPAASPARERPTGAAAGERRAAALTAEDELLRADYQELMEALRASDASLAAADACSSRTLSPFRLEPREVVAFRRLADGADRDPRLDRLVLLAASLRLRIRREAERVHAQPELGPDRLRRPGSPARLAVSLAGDYLERLRHAAEEAVLDGGGPEAYHLQVLRMRLQREAAGLWLLLHAPAAPPLRR